MNTQDIILINAKMKSKGMNRNALAKKIHVSAYHLNRVLDKREENENVESRLILWLNKK